MFLFHCALLNSYGYPSNYLNLIHEQGGDDVTTRSGTGRQTDNPMSRNLFTHTTENEVHIREIGFNSPLTQGLLRETGSLGYIKNNDTLKGLILTNTGSSDLPGTFGFPGGGRKALELDWGAGPLLEEKIDCVEFVFKHSDTTGNKQKLMMNSGSISGFPVTNWEVALEDDKLTFRL